MPPPQTPASTVVVIIGAGAAGLQAARTLLSSPSPPTVVLLESLSRPFGRVYSRPLQGTLCPIDWGAEYIHGTTTMVNELADRSPSLPTKPVFTAAQADGGPDEAPTDEGRYGVYWFDGELHRFDSTAADFVLLNAACQDIENRQEKEFETISGYIHSAAPGLLERASGLFEAGYGNTVGCADGERIGFERIVQCERSWAEKDGCKTGGGGDRRFTGGFCMVSGEVEGSVHYFLLACGLSPSK